MVNGRWERCRVVLTVGVAVRTGQYSGYRGPYSHTTLSHTLTHRTTVWPPHAIGSVTESPLSRSLRCHGVSAVTESQDSTRIRFCLRLCARRVQRHRGIKRMEPSTQLGAGSIPMRAKLLPHEARRCCSKGCGTAEGRRGGEGQGGGGGDSDAGRRVAAARRRVGAKSVGHSASMTPASNEVCRRSDLLYGTFWPGRPVRDPSRSDSARESYSRR